MEKKRRDRINKCLEELKDLMVQSNDKARYQKLEKAEILEMAVSYVKSLKQTASNSFFNEIIDYNRDQKYYLLLFQQLLNDFQNYIKTNPDVKDDDKIKFISYMNQRYDELLVNLNDSNDQHFDSEKTNNRYSPYQQNAYKTDKRHDNMNKLRNYSNGFNQKSTLDESSFLQTTTTIHPFQDSQNSYKQFISFYQTDKSMDSNKFKNSFYASVCFANINETLKTEKVWRPW